jgi:hypothetical protein
MRTTKSEKKQNSRMKKKIEEKKILKAKKTKTKI